MAMLERSKKQRVITNTIVLAIFCSIFLLAGLLIWRASRLGGIDSAVGEKFGLGALQLFELQKQPAGDGGYQATIGFLPGITAYFLTWVIIAAATVMIRLHKTKM